MIYFQLFWKINQNKSLCKTFLFSTSLFHFMCILKAKCEVAGFMQNFHKIWFLLQFGVILYSVNEYTYWFHFCFGTNTIMWVNPRILGPQPKKTVTEYSGSIHICNAQIKRVTAIQINGICAHCQTYDMQTNIQYWWTCTILRILEWHTFVIGVFLSALDIFMPWTRYCLQKWGSWTTMVFRWDKKE